MTMDGNTGGKDERLIEQLNEFRAADNVPVETDLQRRLLWDAKASTLLHGSLCSDKFQEMFNGPLGKQAGGSLAGLERKFAVQTGGAAEVSQALFGGKLGNGSLEPFNDCVFFTAKLVRSSVYTPRQENPRMKNELPYQHNGRVTGLQRTIYTRVDCDEFDTLSLFEKCKEVSYFRFSKPEDLIYDEFPGCENLYSPVTNELGGKRLKIGNFDKRVEEDIQAVAYFYDHKQRHQIQCIVRYDDSSEDGVPFKYFLPATAWRFPGVVEGFVYNVPYGPLQPLWQASRLLQHNESPDFHVVLTPSVELAVNNQKSTNAHFLWTTWYGGLDAMDYVDWKPLFFHQGPVTILANNHSGFDMHAALDQANGIAKKLIELHEKWKSPTGVEKTALDLRVAAIRTDYDDVQNGTPDRSSMAFFTPEELAERCAKLHEQEVKLREQKERQTRGLLLEPEAAPHVQERPDFEAEEQAVDTNYLIRPILRPGAWTMLAAADKSGKTAFALSICGAVLGGTSLIEGKWLTVPKGVSDNACVLFVNLEDNQNRTGILGEAKEFLHPYLPSDPKEFEARRSRFHVADFSGEEHDLLAPEQFSKVIDEIDRIEEEQKPCRVKLVVIDNYLPLVKSDYSPSAWQKAQALLTHISKRGPAVLIVHHLSTGGKKIAAAERLKHAVMAYFTLQRTERDEDDRMDNDDRYDPTIVRLGENGVQRNFGIRNEKVVFDVKEFTVEVVPHQRWRAYPRRSDDEVRSELCQLRDAYRKHGIHVNRAVAPMFGLGKSQFFERCKPPKQKP